MNNTKNKSDIFYFVTLILTLITMIIGITFTFYSLLAEDEKDSTKVQTGTLYITYEKGDKFDSYDLIPLKNEPNIDSTVSTYKNKFFVRSSGTLDQILDVYLIIEQNDFEDGILKYKLYDDNNKEISRGSLPKSGKLLINSNNYLKSGNKKGYTFLLWMSDNNKDQNYEMGNVFKASFEINAYQLKYQ